MPTDGSVRDSGRTPVIDPEESALSFERVKTELDALTLDEFQVINLDVPSVVARVLMAIPGINALRTEFAMLPGVNMERFDNLRDYAHALSHADALYRTATKRSGAAATRQRAYTVLLRAYDEVRRGVEFLRWKDGDSEKVAPSLYLGRRGGPNDQLIVPTTRPGVSTRRPE